MIIGAVADIHGNFDALDARDGAASGRRRSGSASATSPAAPARIPSRRRRSTGSRATTRTSIASPRGRPGSRATATCTTSRTAPPPIVGPLRVAGLGGTFAPKWLRHACRADCLTRRRDDKRRHFVREEVEACKRLRGVRHPDDARGGATVHRRSTMTGREAEHGVAMPASRRSTRCSRRCKPRLHLCGHHHRFVETMREGVPSVCIDRINRSYLLIDAADATTTAGSTKRDVMSPLQTRRR